MSRNNETEKNQFLIPIIIGLIIIGGSFIIFPIINNQKQERKLKSEAAKLEAREKCNSFAEKIFREMQNRTCFGLGKEEGCELPEPLYKKLNDSLQQEKENCINKYK